MFIAYYLIVNNMRKVFIFTRFCVILIQNVGEKVPIKHFGYIAMEENLNEY